MMYKNVFFFHTINSIGGVETMFWELAKKYHQKFDITIYYYKGDSAQVKRLEKYVRVIKFANQQIECEKAFFNYDLEPFIRFVKAKHKYEIVHADFELQKNLVPHIDARIDEYIAVSKTVAKSFKNRTGISCKVCANPLTLEQIDNPPLFICAAQRLTSEKGRKRIEELVRRLDNDKDIKYYMLVFTNDINAIKSNNVAFMPPRLDIRPFIYGCDVFIALSDSEGRCYSVGEKLGYGTGKLLITPCPSFFEQGANKDNSIVLDFDMNNMDSVINELKNLYHSKHITQTHKPIMPNDKWNTLLAKGKPTYEGIKRYLVRTTDVYQKFNVYDTQLKKVPKENEEMIVDGERLNILQHYSQGSLVEVVEEVK